VSADAGSAAETRPETAGRAAVGGSQPPVRWRARPAATIR